MTPGMGRRSTEHVLWVAWRLFLTIIDHYSSVKLERMIIEDFVFTPCFITGTLLECSILFLLSQSNEIFNDDMDATVLRLMD